ncbi:pyruvate kinase [Nitrospira sp.]|nr:pyruvate kinase [Nitrospira sp.]
MRKAKIICTLGPATSTPDVLVRLLDAGMDVARLNFSHGTHESHAQTITAVRQTGLRLGRNVAILQDLQGPRIRLGHLPSDGIRIDAGQRIRLRGGMLRSGGQHGFQSGRSIPDMAVPVTYPQLARDAKPGARVLIDDGLVELRVLSIDASDLLCAVVSGGVLRSHKGMNLPGTVVSAPAVTDKDREDLAFGIEQGVDYVALSFVRGPEDIETARTAIRDRGGSQPIIAKIERAEAIEKLDSVIDAADGVMVARGDLGVEMGPETVPILQKRIIEAANRVGRVVITATQMLESMTHHPSPTRAEASDVANAVFDGTDAVMLSGETAVGEYPIESVAVMNRLVQAAEEAAPLRFQRETDRVSLADRISEAICRAASSSAAVIQARAIVALTESGRTARLLSKERPRVPIVALTPTETVRRRLAMLWGVQAGCFPVMEQNDDRVRRIDAYLKMHGLAEAGDRIVMVSGVMAGQPGGTNVMKLYEVG